MWNKNNHRIIIGKHNLSVLPNKFNDVCVYNILYNFAHDLNICFPHIYLNKCLKNVNAGYMNQMFYTLMMPLNNKRFSFSHAYIQCNNDSSPIKPKLTFYRHYFFCRHMR